MRLIEHGRHVRVTDEDSVVHVHLHGRLLHDETSRHTITPCKPIKNKRMTRLIKLGLIQLSNAESLEILQPHISPSSPHLRYSSLCTSTSEHMLARPLTMRCVIVTQLSETITLVRATPRVKMQLASTI